MLGPKPIQFCGQSSLSSSPAVREMNEGGSLKAKERARRHAISALTSLLSEGDTVGLRRLSHVAETQLLFAFCHFTCLYMFVSARRDGVIFTHHSQNHTSKHGSVKSFVDFWLQFRASLVPVVMYGCESWTVKKAEHRRTDTFELWCWRRLLWVPWMARSSN